MNAQERLAPPPTLGDYARLVRLPNVFTALSDALLGFLLVHAPTTAGAAARMVAVVGGGASLYLAGMVWNDYFDRRLDAVERPERPIPSGRVSAGAARRLALALTAVGLLLGGAAVWRPGGAAWPVAVVVGLAALIVLYDAWAKPTVAGPLVMGACRAVHIMMAALAAAAALEIDHRLDAIPLATGAAAGTGCYVAGITWFAREEAVRSRRAGLVGAVLVMVGGLTLWASLPWSIGPPATARLTLHPPLVWPLLVAILAAAPLARWLVAVADPSPRRVQLGVKQAILFLIVIDAALVLAFRGPGWSLAVLALIVPAELLGRRIRTT